jgi:DNA-binding response OmpR family regulator
VADGYDVSVAKDGREAWLVLNGNDRPHLLILDLELPYLEELVELAHFREGEPTMPLIIFSFLPIEIENGPALKAAAFLEKKEDTDRLKALVAEVIGRFYPHRLAGHDA